MIKLEISNMHVFICSCGLTIVRAEIPGFVVQSQRSLGVAPFLAEPAKEGERKERFRINLGDLNRPSAWRWTPPLRRVLIK